MKPPTWTLTRVTGELAIVTPPASFGIAATAAECVSASDQTDPATGTTFTAWVAGSCDGRFYVLRPGR